MKYIDLNPSNFKGMRLGEKFQDTKDFFELDF